eukprot:1691919-Pyramimonas_sp.AAC.1
MGVTCPENMFSFSGREVNGKLGVGGWSNLEGVKTQRSFEDATGPTDYANLARSAMSDHLADQGPSCMCWAFR